MQPRSERKIFFGRLYVDTRVQAMRIVRARIGSLLSHDGAGWNRFLCHVLARGNKTKRRLRALFIRQATLTRGSVYRNTR